MKIAILGAQGFIGSNLVSFFLGQGHSIYGIDLVEYSTAEYTYQKVSILSPDFQSLFNEQAFDVCINASGSGNVAYSLSHPISDFEANTYSVGIVLDTIRKYHPSCKYIHLSSAAVYGNPRQLPVKETDACAPLSPYGFHKWMSEIICMQYRQLYDLPIAVLRPFSVYGNGLKKQLLWDTCKKLSRQKAISLFGTGNETRDFIHISDLAALISLLMEKATFSGEIYNAASGSETSIRHIATLFEKNFPDGKQVSFSGEAKPGDPINWRADISRITELGFQPAVILEEAVIDYIQWYGNLTHE